MRRRRGLFFDRFGYDFECFQSLWTENHCDRDISCITAPSDDDASDSAPVMPSVKRVPTSVRADIEPSAEVHRVK
jgi:hypothetical protein